MRVLRERVISNRDRKMNRRKKDELYFGKIAKSWVNRKTPCHHSHANHMRSYLEWKQSQKIKQ